jgi:hypothetical protein
VGKEIYFHKSGQTGLWRKNNWAKIAIPISLAWMEAGFLRINDLIHAHDVSH